MFSIPELIIENYLVKECGSTNIRVRKASLSVIGEIHTQVGPMLKALVNSNGNVDDAIKKLVETELELHPFNPDKSSESRKKKGPATKNSSSSSSRTRSDGFEIPKIDFVASLPDNCMENLVRRSLVTACFSIRFYLIPIYSSNTKDYQRRKGCLEEEKGST